MSASDFFKKYQPLFEASKDDEEKKDDKKDGEKDSKKDGKKPAWLTAVEEKAEEKEGKKPKNVKENSSEFFRKYADMIAEAEAGDKADKSKDKKDAKYVQKGAKIPKGYEMTSQGRVVKKTKGERPLGESEDYDSELDEPMPGRKGEKGKSATKKKDDDGYHKKELDEPMPKKAKDKSLTEGAGHTAVAKEKNKIYNPAAKDSRNDQAGYGKKINNMKKRLRAKDLNKKQESVSESYFTEGEMRLLEKWKNSDTLNEKWENSAPLNPKKKGMFKGRSKESLESELAKLKKSGPHKKGSPQYTKEKELNFAIRAKGNWGKTKESIGEAEQVNEKKMGFAAVEKAVAKNPKVKNPAAVAASIGRKKYGQEAMTKKSVAGKEDKK